MPRGSVCRRLAIVGLALLGINLVEWVAISPSNAWHGREAWLTRSQFDRTLGQALASARWSSSGRQARPNKSSLAALVDPSFEPRMQVVPLAICMVHSTASGVERAARLKRHESGERGHRQKPALISPLGHRRAGSRGNRSHPYLPEAAPAGRRPWPPLCRGTRRSSR